MVAYSFKSRFANPILLGLGEKVHHEPGGAHVYMPKQQTIRATGKRRHARPGETLQLYTGMRTRQCRKIGEARCTDVRSIRIIVREEKLTVELDGRWINGRKLKDFARRDGFVDADDMLAFWKDEHGLGEFYGMLIRWEPLP